MKPLAVFRHSPGEGPGYFATFLERHGLPWELVAIDAGAMPPPDVREFSGLCFMGGPMSVNDDLPWIAPALALIRDADRRRIPVIGHCLGGQLMSKAFGAAVTRNPVKEIGWGKITAVDSEATKDWLGETLSANRELLAFHWHGETFAMPNGAQRILASAACPNQAWVRGPHLAMQCHVEMTPSMIASWCEIGAEEIAAASHQATVQQAAAMLENLAERIATLRTLADQIYARWLSGLMRAV